MTPRGFAQMKTAKLKHSAESQRIPLNPLKHYGGGAKLMENTGPEVIISGPY